MPSDYQDNAPQSTGGGLASFADFVADIVEAKGAHWADGGFSDQLERDGYTKAGRKRLAEQLRETASRHRQGKLL